jgi:hypothetical protein
MVSKIKAIMIIFELEVSILEILAP